VTHLAWRTRLAWLTRKRLWAATAVALVLTLGLAYGTFTVSRSRTFQFFGGLTHRVETSEKLVALTFDDGPTEHTTQVLATLDELDTKATFYLTGSELAASPEIGRAVAAAGHELGNHSYSHQRMVFTRPSTVASEIERTDALIRATGFGGDITFRPPYGKKLLTLPYYLDQHDRKTITWDVEPDSDPSVAGDADRIVRYTVERTRPGSIILLHASYDRPHARDAVPGVIETLRGQGYRFVTVSELLAARR